MKRKQQRLRDYDPAEISLVSRPANYKKFLIHKQAQSSGDIERASMAAIKKLPAAMLNAIDACATGDWVQKASQDDEAEDRTPLSEGAQAALKAIGRIMAPYRDELKDAHMDAIQEAVGVGDAQVHARATPDGIDDPADDDDDAVNTEGDDAADDADDSDDPKDSNSTPTKSGDIVSQAMDTSGKLSQKAFASAMQAAQKAFASALKTSVNKSSEEAPANAPDEAPDAVSNDDEHKPPVAVQGKQEDKQNAPQPDSQPQDKEQPVNKSAYDELRAQFDELKKSHKDLVEKSASRDKELAEQREQALARDYAERAQAYASIGDPAKIGAILKSSHGNKEAQDNLEAILKSAMERSRAKESFGGDLLGEIGTSQANDAHAGSAESQIQTLVSECIQKSADNKLAISREQAMVNVLKTPEGRAAFKRLTQEGV